VAATITRHYPAYLKRLETFQDATETVHSHYNRLIDKVPNVVGCITRSEGYGAIDLDHPSEAFSTETKHKLNTPASSCSSTALAARALGGFLVILRSSLEFQRDIFDMGCLAVRLYPDYYSGLRPDSNRIDGCESALFTNSCIPTRD
jgi:hypothetical protein